LVDLWIVFSVWHGLAAPIGLSVSEPMINYCSTKAKSQENNYFIFKNKKPCFFDYAVVRF
jgi:hypothetical protein